MPTTRSKYTYAQFKQVFQKWAHEMAIEAVTDLVTGGEGLLIKGYSSGQLSEVRAGDSHIKFGYRKLSFYYKDHADPDHMDFEIEEKFYSSSAHCTKISFYSPEYKENNPDIHSWDQLVDHEKTDAEKQRRQKKIDEFLEQLMKDADMKIEPRFSLSEL